MISENAIRGLASSPRYYINDSAVKLIYIDLFCGAGGTSTGVELATLNGLKIARVIACVNHDKNAIASHKANHPFARHYNEDIRWLDLTDLVAYTNLMRKKYPNAILVIWASLECTNYSRAKGGLPRNADSRTLPNYLFQAVKLGRLNGGLIFI